MINKRQSFLKLSEWMLYNQRGNYWYSFLLTFIDPSKFILLSGIIKLNFQWIPWWVLIFGYIAVNIATEFAKYFMGRLDYKKGMAKVQQEFMQKAEEVAPFNNQVEESIKAICEHLGIEHKFKKL